MRESREGAHQHDAEPGPIPEARAHDVEAPPVVDAVADPKLQLVEVFVSSTDESEADYVARRGVQSAKSGRPSTSRAKVRARSYV